MTVNANDRDTNIFFSGYPLTAGAVITIVPPPPVLGKN